MTDTIPEAVIEAMADNLPSGDSAARRVQIVWAIKAAQALGWKLVPVEPTEAMIAGGDNAVEKLVEWDSSDLNGSYYVCGVNEDAMPGDVYRAMIAASPEVG